MTDINQILKERQKTHGDYREHADCTHDLLSYMTSYRNWEKLTASQRETLHMIAHKIGRIMTGDPNVADHWLDIAGYSQLIVNQLELPPGPGTPEDGGHHARQDDTYCVNCGVRSL